MKEFKYIIKDAVGIHARPASLITKMAAAVPEEVSIEKDGKEASCKRLIALMSLGIRNGDQVTVRVEGPNEDAVLEQFKMFFQENL